MERRMYALKLNWIASEAELLVDCQMTILVVVTGKRREVTEV